MLIEREHRPAQHRVLQGSVDETEGNERLTASTGMALILMTAALGMTIIDLRLLIWEHLFIGLLVIPLAGVIVAGLVLAIVLIPDFATWTASHAWIHHHEG